MATLNKCTFIGRLGRDPDMTATGGGLQIAKWSIAVSEKFKDRSGEQKESTEWVNLVSFSKGAELVERLLHKGDLVWVEGKLKNQSWEKDGQKHYKTEFVVNEFQKLSFDGQGTASKASSFDAPTDQAPTDSLPF